MAVENIAVFTIPPDWSSGIIETLSWRTSVSESNLAFEQRMGLRLSPRQSFEIGYTLFGPQRTHFDLLVNAAAGSPMYLPLWHESEKLTASVSIGATVLSLETQYTEFQNVKYAILINDEYDFEVVEIDSYTSNSLTLVAGLSNDWLIGSKIYPVKKCRVENHPSGERYADKAFRPRMRFISMEANKSNAGAILGTFLENYVLETDSNDAEAMSYEYDRKMFVLDSEVGLQGISDVIGSLSQSYSRLCKGRQSHSGLRGTLYALQGQRVPIWVPSHFSDFDLTDDVDAADTTLSVKRCGFTDTGGPVENREYILIHLRDGTRIYRKITGSAIVGGGATESLSLETAVGLSFSSDAVKRISFLSFSRLAQDTVELNHLTDTKGVTVAKLLFRNAKEASPPSIPPSSEIPPIFDSPSYNALLRSGLTNQNPSSLSLIALGGIPSTGYVTSSPTGLIVFLIGFHDFNSSTLREVTSVVSTSGLTFTLAGKHNFIDTSRNNTRYHLEVWTAVAPLALVDEEITATLDGPTGQIVGILLAVQGANNAVPFDASVNPILFADGIIGDPPSISYSTSNPYDLILRVHFGNGITNNGSVPPGWLSAHVAWWNASLYDSGIPTFHSYYKRVTTIQNETLDAEDSGIMCLIAIRN